MAYLIRPAVLLLDEPAAGLERSERPRIDRLVEAAQRHEVRPRSLRRRQQALAFAHGRRNQEAADLASPQLGNCVSCQTAEGGGAPLDGGRTMTTPFGTIVTTNITPGPATGIGTWSFSAFQGAMRDGIARDGRHLYPAFPYTAFTQGDDELQALYAWMMTRPRWHTSRRRPRCDSPSTSEH